MRHKYIQHIAQVALAMALLGGTTSCEGSRTCYLAEQTL